MEETNLLLAGGIFRGAAMTGASEYGLGEDGRSGGDLPSDARNTTAFAGFVRIASLDRLDEEGVILIESISG